MIKIEEFIEDFGKGINTLMEFRINREDIKVLVSPFVFSRIRESFHVYLRQNMDSGIWNYIAQTARWDEISVMGVTFGPTEGWPNFNVMLSFRDADIIASKVKPIVLESKKWL